jgi:hypothetical protein
VPSEAVVALMSAAEDLGAFLGSVLVLAVPYAGYACVGVTGFVYWRVRDRRRSKYKKMRRTAVRAAEAEAEADRLAKLEGGRPGTPESGRPGTAVAEEEREAARNAPDVSGGDADGR